MNPNPTDIIGSALIDAFAQRGHTVSLPDPDSLDIVRADGTMRANIAEWRQHAGRNSRADLPGIAADYADQVLRMLEQGTQRPTGGDVLTAGNLRVRIYPDDALSPEMQAAFVTRQLAPGLLQTVVADFPDSIAPLNWSELGDVSADAAFGAALTHSIEDEPHYVQTNEVDGVRIGVIGETHRYIGAHVHVLGRHFPGQHPFGALVAFPLPEYLMVHEIGSEQHLVLALSTMQNVARKLFDDGEKAISPQIYWWRPGEYEKLDERTALHGGHVPDLRPVSVVVGVDDDGGLQVAMHNEDTAELIQAWHAGQGD